jgi:hypothetical protein
MKKILTDRKTFVIDRKGLAARGLIMTGGQHAGIPCKIVEIENRRMVVAEVIAVVDNDGTQTPMERIQSIEACYDPGHEDHYLTLRKYNRFDHVKQIVCRPTGEKKELPEA